MKTEAFPHSFRRNRQHSPRSGIPGPVSLRGTGRLFPVRVIAARACVSHVGCAVWFVPCSSGSYTLPHGAGSSASCVAFPRLLRPDAHNCLGEHRPCAARIRPCWPRGAVANRRVATDAAATVHALPRASWPRARRAASLNGPRASRPRARRAASLGLAHARACTARRSAGTPRPTPGHGRAAGRRARPVGGGQCGCGRQRSGCVRAHVTRTWEARVVPPCWGSRDVTGAGAVGCAVPCPPRRCDAGRAAPHPVSGRTARETPHRGPVPCVCWVLTSVSPTT